MSSLSRSKAVLLAAEALKIIKEGFYLAPDGTRVELGAQIKAARRDTRAYPPGSTGKTPSIAPAQSGSCRIEVKNETTFQGGRRLTEAGLRPLALNFASAKNPGGGFKNGARAQEESLCRDSALFECLHGQHFYDFHRDLGGALYSDYALYSPAVPVFRGESGFLLAQPWSLSILTCAAPNATALALDDATQQLILPAFETRIRKIAAIALENGHDALVLGAWGCGAFGNNPLQIAPIFARVLDAELAGAFRHILFAVLDNSPDARMITPFEVAFSDR